VSSGGGLFSSAASATVSGGGFLGFNSPPAEGAAPAPSTKPEGEADEDAAPDEEVTIIPGWTASCSLDVKDTVETGEEDEEELYSQRSKLYRFHDGEWKERGLGDAKLLKHKQTGKVRLMLRQEKTMKIVANHYVIDVPPYCDLQPNAGSDKCWVWTVQDCSEDEPVVERLALKFGNPEVAAQFKKEFDSAKEMNRAFADELNTGAGEPGAAPKAVAKESEAAKPSQAAAAPEAAPAPFSFAFSKAAPTTKPETDKPEAEDEKSAETPFAGVSLFAPAPVGLFGSGFDSSSGGLFGSTPSFASAPSSGGLFSGAASTGGGLFGGTGAGLFGGAASTGGGLFGSSISSGGGLFSGPAPAAPAPAEEEENVVDIEEEVTSIPGWAPSVSLEVKDTVETGEEDEEELYSQRSKLYRYKDGDWKERGLGNAKLLKHKGTGKIRFMLRQDKTMKIVANHYVVSIPPFCDLSPNAGSEKCWVWNAQNSTEEGLEVEQMALKFGSPELASAFKKAFDEAKEVNAQIDDFKKLANGSGGGASASASPSPKATPKSAPAKPPVTAEAVKSLNGNGSAAEEKAAQPTAFSTLSFSGSGSGGGLFDSAAGGLFGGASSSSTGFFGNATGGLFSSAVGSSSSSTISSSTGLFGGNSGGGGLFGGSSAGGLFGGAAAASSTSSAGGLFGGASSGGGGLFGGLATGGGLFGTPASAGGLFGASAPSAAPTSGLWGAPAAAPPGDSAPLGTANGDGANQGQGGDDDYVVEEEVTAIPGWTASVNLEVKECVETGEEMEEEIYSQRSKLYRFSDGDWKERGLGDAKLLRHYETGKTRFLLRQEKTMKIVANHYIIDQAPYCDLKSNKGSDKCWVWTALDCADGDGKPVAEQFALKFRSPELAEEFRSAFDAAKSGEWPEEGEDDEQYQEEEWVQAEIPTTTKAAGGGGSLADMAAAQAKDGWRCPGCRLQWGDKVVECGVCEIARPGFEEQAAAAKAGKDSGKKDAAAAFLGSSSAPSSTPSGGLFGAPSSSSAAPVTFGFGSGPAAAPASGASLFGGAASASGGLFGTSAASASGGLFGTSAASSGGLFGAPAAGLFGTPAASSGGSAMLFGAPASSPVPAAPLFGAVASEATASTALQKASPQNGPSPNPLFRPPTPPAAVVPAPTPAGGGFGAFAPAGSFGVPQMSPPAGPAPAGFSLAGGFGLPMTMPAGPTPAAIAGAGFGTPMTMQPGFCNFPPMQSPAAVPDQTALVAALQAMLTMQAKAAVPSAAPATPGASEASLRAVEEKIRKLEMSLRDQEDHCSKADERARKADERCCRSEEQLESLRQETAALRRKQQEDSELIRRLQSKGEEQLQMLDAVKRDIKQEKDLRTSHEVSQKATSETLQSALKVSNSALQTAEGAQQALRQMRDERSSSLASVSASVESLERYTKDRLEAVEAKIEKTQQLTADTTGTRSTPNRIAYFQGLHVQQTGRRLLGVGNEDGSGSGEGVIVAREPMPLMRRIP